MPAIAPRVGLKRRANLFLPRFWKKPFEKIDVIAEEVKIPSGTIKSDVGWLKFFGYLPDKQKTEWTRILLRQTLISNGFEEIVTRLDDEQVPFPEVE